ncbi:MAG TPA: thiamine phosphate synthase [Armatimonadota bacterium]|jgi:thiamine-phosphate pyrophosphorylase
MEGVYVITDEELMPGRSHVDIARAAVEGGARIIQLRDKHASDEYMTEAGLAIRRITRDAGAIFIVNDRLEVALACDADGLHVGQEDAPALRVRPLLGGRLLGVSVSTVEEAVKAREDGADHVGYGPVFPTSTKQDAGPVTGINQIPSIRTACGLPVVAIGGINLQNIGAVASAGADAAAVISAVVCADDMAEATRQMVRAWAEGKRR